MATQTATKSSSRKSNRKPYDPGFKGTITSEGAGRFIVESFRNRGEHYSVDLAEGTCTCPHFIHRIAPAIEAGEIVPPCKHIEAAATASHLMAIDVCRQLSADNLRFQATRTDLRPEVAAAVSFVLRYREETESYREENPVYLAA